MLREHSGLKRLVGLSLILSLVNVFPVGHWAQEININLAVYYLAAHLFCILTYVFFRKTTYFKLKAITVAGLCFMSVYYLVTLLPFYGGVSKEAWASADMGAVAKLRLFYANVHSDSDHYSTVREQIEKANPDLVALIEVNKKWKDNIGLSGKYPYSFEFPREDNFGVAIYSKIPFAAPDARKFGETVPPVLYTTLETDKGRKIDFALLHALPPLTNDAIYMSKVLLRRVSTLLRHSENEVLVAGDFNATPFSSQYQRFAWGSRVEDAMKGFGLLRSWNAWSPIVRLTLDHVFYRGNIRVEDFQTLEPGKSDHFPYLVDFELLS